MYYDYYTKSYKHTRVRGLSPPFYKTWLFWLFMLGFFQGVSPLILQGAMPLILQSQFGLISESECINRITQEYGVGQAVACGSVPIAILKMTADPTTVRQYEETQAQKLRH